MAIFNYTLPSGSQFRMEAPAGTTQSEADRIFYTQVAAGSLVGYEPGQTLTNVEAQLIKFELSRLDRGTAGVDTNPVLAIIQGLSTRSSDLQSLLSRLLAQPVPINIVGVGGIESDIDIPLRDPIDEADIVLIGSDDFPFTGISGTNGARALTEYQVQKLLAQIANLVDQESDQISLKKGIGRYGFTAYQLEQAGYVKPGTSLKYFSSSNTNFVDIMSSPSVWTGRNGVYSLDSILEDPLLQNQIQARLMQQGYNNLVENGIIVTTPTPAVSISTGQVYTNTGLRSTQTLTTLGLLGTNLSSLSESARTALVNSPALSRVLNAATVDLNTIISGAVSNLPGSLGTLGNIKFTSASTVLTNQITGSVGALVANASKYGTQATALWAQASNLQNINLSSITTNLTNLVPPNLSGLTSNLDILGKAAGFATNFANPLAGFNNVGGLLIAGGGIGGALTGQLENLQGVVTGQLENLQGLVTGQLSEVLTGALGNLGSLTNFGALGGLFGGGGDLVSGTQVAAGFNNTVNRATVDAAFQRTLGSAKIPLPVFQYPGPVASALRLDIQQAQNFLKNLQTQGQSVVAGAGRLLG